PAAERARLALMKISLILSACLLTTFVFGGCRNSQPTAEEFRSLISTQLPVGSSKSQVAAFLDSRGIRHSEMKDQFEYDDAHQYRKFRIMSASIRRDSFWTKSQVLMIFYFDDSERLTKYDVKNVNTGL